MHTSTLTFEIGNRIQYSYIINHNFKIFRYILTLLSQERMKWPKSALQEAYIVIFTIYMSILHIEPVHSLKVKIVCSVKIHLSVIINHQKEYPDMATRPLFYANTTQHVKSFCVHFACFSDVLSFNSKVFIPLIVFNMIFWFYAPRAFKITPDSWKSEFSFFSTIFAVFKRILHIEPVHRSPVKIKIVKSIQYLWRINDHFTISIFFALLFQERVVWPKSAI